MTADSRRTIKSRASAAAGNPRKATSSALGRGDLVESLVLIFPLFLLYSVGVVFSSTKNGVDFVTQWILVAVDGDRTHYFFVQLGFTAVFIGVLLYLRSQRAIRVHHVTTMFLESAIYALTLGTLIVFVMQNVLGFAIGGAWAPFSLGGAEPVVTSAGAGVYEELVFRLGMFAGGVAVLRRLGLGRAAIVVSLLLSSAVFSAVHHIGPLGDDWELSRFTYRALAGVAFGAIFYYRSLAHAVYAHFLYDVYVLMVLRPG